MHCRRVSATLMYSLLVRVQSPTLKLRFALSSPTTTAGTANTTTRWQHPLHTAHLVAILRPHHCGANLLGHAVFVGAQRDDSGIQRPGGAGLRVVLRIRV